VWTKFQLRLDVTSWPHPDTHTGPIGDNVLRYEESVPLTLAKPGEVVVRVQRISVGPATRGWMNDTPSLSGAVGVPPGGGQ
jgi:NADPH-dependent curcumin reductase CurA